MWTDSKGGKFERLIECNCAQINNFSYLYYRFDFGEMNEFDRTSIFIKIQNMWDRNVFEPNELVRYFLDRKINFRLNFTPRIDQKFKDNWIHFRNILRLKVSILTYALRLTLLKSL